MKLQWGDLAGIAVMAAAGFTVCYAAFRRALRRALSDQQHAIERQLAALAATIRTLEDKVAELSRIPALEASAASEFEMVDATEIQDALPPVAVEQEDDAEDEEVPAEIMPVLAAAATAFLGRKVRILSARKLQSPRQGMSPWSQEGRVFVQGSHNLWARG